MKKFMNLLKDMQKKRIKILFFLHVTLVSHIDSEETALKILNKLLVKKSTVIFDRVSTGDTYFQKLYLESSDNSYFFNAVSKIEVWPSLWVPHMSLCYGDELPKSFDLGELNELIPITISFDTLSLYKTGPNISEWKEITTLRLN